MRVVAKIGTSSLTDQLGVIDAAVIDALCDQLAQLRRNGHEVILVSSGAVSAGVAALGLSARPTDMPTLQAISAAGQSRLMETYNRCARPPRSRRRAGAAGAARLRRSAAVPPRPPDARAAARARLRPDRQRERRDRERRDSATATTIASPRWSPTTSPPTCWCCSPTRPACTPPIRARTRRPRSSTSCAADDPLLSVAATEVGTAPAAAVAWRRSCRRRGWRRGPACAPSSPAPVAPTCSSTPWAAHRSAPRSCRATAQPSGAQALDRFRHQRRGRAGRRRRGQARAARAGHVAAARGHRRGHRTVRHRRRGRGSAICSASRIARGITFSDSEVLRSIKGRRTSDLPLDVAHEAIHRDDLLVLQ